MGMTLHGESGGSHGGGHGPAPRLYAWVVFALTFGLMLSDYLSRQVITPIFPFLKLEWSLTDTQLGALVSVVALIVGVSAVPIALLADRWGRVKSITVMAGLWGTCHHRLCGLPTATDKCWSRGRWSDWGRRVTAAPAARS